MPPDLFYVRGKLYHHQNKVQVLINNVNKFYENLKILEHNLHK